MKKTDMKKITLTLLLTTLLGCSNSVTFNEEPDNRDTFEKQFSIMEKSLNEIKTANNETLLKYAKDKDKTIRRAAILKIGELGVDNPHISAVLSDAIANDKDYRVRTAAARTAGTLGDAQTSDALVKAICDKDYSVSLYAWKSILKMGINAKSGILNAISQKYPYKNLQCKTFEDKKSTLQQLIYTRLKDMDEKVLPILLEGIKSDDETISIASLKLLGNLKFKAQDALPEITEIASSSNDEKIQITAIESIQQIGDLHPLVIPTLFNIKNSTQSPTVKMSVSRAIAFIERVEKQQAAAGAKGPSSPGNHNRLRSRRS
ncbi:MAG: HEAT repeat domain-containing protein [Deltaproteobacteria bacterium]|nr:HEAT repeat domain-containing protein [Deltaproteobacteria bacterium]